LDETWGCHVSRLSNVKPRYFTAEFQGIFTALLNVNCAWGGGGGKDED